MLNEARQEAKEQEVCPNPTLYDTKSGKLVKLHDAIAESSKALTVLNFGSCTWPPFMAHMEEVRRVHASYSKLANFITIYIEEAHPNDRGDFVNYKFPVDQHKWVPKSSWCVML